MIRHVGLLSFLTILIVGIGLCPSFSEEHQLRTDQVLLSSKNGRLPLFLAKLLVSICFAITVSLVLYGVQLAICGALFGLHGYSAPLQLWADGGGLWDCSVGQYSLCMVGILILSAIMLAVLVLMVSESTRSSVSAVMIPFALVAVSAFDRFSQINRSAQKIISYLPTIRISTKTLEDYHLVSFAGLDLNCLAFSPILYGLSAALFAALCWLFYRRYQVTGR